MTGFRRGVVYIGFRIALLGALVATPARAEVIEAYLGWNYATTPYAVSEIELLEITYVGGSGSTTVRMPDFPDPPFHGPAWEPYAGMPDGQGVEAKPTYTTRSDGDAETTRTVGRSLPIDWDTSGPFPRIEITQIVVEATGGVWTGRFSDPYPVGLIASGGTDSELESALPPPRGDLYDALRGAPGNPAAKATATGAPAGFESLVGNVFGEFSFAAAAEDPRLWVPQPSGTEAALSDVWGSAPTDVFAVGDGGTVVHYDGSAWTTQPTDSTARLNAVWGSGPGDVFAVGDGGTVLHYDGQGWSSRSSGTEARLHGVWGSAPDRVFAVGFGPEGGLLLRFDGSGWEQVRTFPKDLLLDVWGRDAARLFVVAGGGTEPVASGGNVYEIPVGRVLASTDGGSSWEPLLQALYDDLFAVWGTGSALYAAGGNFADGPQYGVIYRGGGGAWSGSLPVDPPLAPAGVRGLWGASSTAVFAVGDSGTILRHADAGWAKETSGTSRTLRGVWGACPAQVFAVGDGGTVLLRNELLEACEQRPEPAPLPAPVLQPR